MATDIRTPAPVGEPLVEEVVRAMWDAGTTFMPQSYPGRAFDRLLPSLKEEWYAKARAALAVFERHRGGAAHGEACEHLMEAAALSAQLVEAEQKVEQLETVNAALRAALEGTGDWVTYETEEGIVTERRGLAATPGEGGAKP